MPPHIEQAYKKLKLAIILFYDTDTYQIILDYLNHKIPKTPIIPNTIGSYLFGCSNSKDNCSILCVNSIHPNNSNICSYQIWQLINNKLELINDDDSDFAHIYVDTNTDISTINYEPLIKNNVNKFIIVDHDNKPLSETIVLSNNQQINNQKVNTPIKFNSLWLWGLLVFIIILILLSLYSIYNNKPKYTLF